MYCTARTEASNLVSSDPSRHAKPAQPANCQKNCTRNKSYIPSSPIINSTQRKIPCFILLKSVLLLHQLKVSTPPPHQSGERNNSHPQNPNLSVPQAIRTVSQKKQKKTKTNSSSKSRSNQGFFSSNPSLADVQDYLFLPLHLEIPSCISPRR